MSKAGYNKTAEQCREKIKKLKLKYKKIKDAQQTSEVGRQDWPYFDDMDAVFGTLAWLERELHTHYSVMIFMTV